MKQQSPPTMSCGCGQLLSGTLMLASLHLLISPVVLSAEGSGQIARSSKFFDIWDEWRARDLEQFATIGSNAGIDEDRSAVPRI